jgi:hypothetical protein
MGGEYATYEREVMNIFRVLVRRDHMGELGIFLITIF